MYCVRRILIIGFALMALSVHLSAQAPDPPHRVALVDMAYIFKNYRKFDVLTAQLQEQVKLADDEAQAQLESMRALQARLQAGTLLAGSPEHAALEHRLIELQTQLQARRQLDEREFQTQEAAIYKSIYLEASAAVTRYARHFGYTIVLRFNRTNLHDAEDPREILDQLNNEFVFYRPSDDISGPILNMLNEQWDVQQKSAKSTPPPAAAQALTPASK